MKIIAESGIAVAVENDLKISDPLNALEILYNATTNTPPKTNNSKSN